MTKENEQRLKKCKDALAEHEWYRVGMILAPTDLELRILISNCCVLAYEHGIRASEDELYHLKREDRPHDTD